MRCNDRSKVDNSTCGSFGGAIHFNARNYVTLSYLELVCGSVPFYVFYEIPATTCFDFNPRLLCPPIYVCGKRTCPTKIVKISAIYVVTNLKHYRRQFLVSGICRVYFNDSNLALFEYGIVCCPVVVCVITQLDPCIQYFFCHINISPLHIANNCIIGQNIIISGSWYLIKRQRIILHCNVLRRA